MPTPGLAWSSCYFPAYCTSALLPRDAGTANVPQYLKINLLSFETIAGETLGKLKGRVLLQEQPTVETAQQDSEHGQADTDGYVLINLLA